MYSDTQMRGIIQYFYIVTNLEDLASIMHINSVRDPIDYRGAYSVA